MANKESTKTGGKVYSINLKDGGIPGTIDGITKEVVMNLAEYQDGTSGAPEQQERKPFGSTDAGGPHIY